MAPTTPSRSRGGPAPAGRRWLAPLGLGFALGAAAAWAVAPGAAGDPVVRAEPPPPIRLELAREWRQLLPPPITFDHMFRRDPDAVWR